MTPPNNPHNTDEALRSALWLIGAFCISALIATYAVLDHAIEVGVVR